MNREWIYIRYKSHIPKYKVGESHSGRGSWSVGVGHLLCLSGAESLEGLELSIEGSANIGGELGPESFAFGESQTFVLGEGLPVGDEELVGVASLGSFDLVGELDVDNVRPSGPAGSDGVLVGRIVLGRECFPSVFVGLKSPNAGSGSLTGVEVLPVHGEGVVVGQRFRVVFVELGEKLDGGEGDDFDGVVGDSGVVVVVVAERIDFGLEDLDLFGLLVDGLLEFVVVSADGLVDGELGLINGLLSVDQLLGGELDFLTIGVGLKELHHEFLELLGGGLEGVDVGVVGHGWTKGTVLRGGLGGGLFCFFVRGSRSTGNRFKFII
jgi:hypothetical protein